MNTEQFKTVIEEDLMPNLPLKRVYDWAYRDINKNFYICQDGNYISIRNSGTNEIDRFLWTGNPMNDRKFFIECIMDRLRKHDLLNIYYRDIVEVDLYILEAFRER